MTKLSIIAMTAFFVIFLATALATGWEMTTILAMAGFIFGFDAWVTSMITATRFESYIRANQAGEIDARKVE